MAIQYSGLTIVNTTFTCTTGTRQEIVNGVAAALLAAGWTQVAGISGGTDQTLKSGTTPQGFAIRIRVFEPGAGNCAQLFMHNATGSLTQTTNPIFLLPSVGAVYRVIASAYQFFILQPGITTVRTFACGGVPYVPSFLTSGASPTTAVGWLTSNAQSDTDATVRTSFRTNLGCISANCSGLYNGTLWANFGGGSGNHALVVPVSAIQQTWTAGGSDFNYSDGSALIVDPLIAWGTTNLSALGVIYGQLWDAAVITDSFVADTAATFDSHNWFNITGSNVGTNVLARGSLFVVVP
jgi:hypothetical protein